MEDPYDNKSFHEYHKYSNLPTRADLFCMGTNWVFAWGRIREEDVFKGDYLEGLRCVLIVLIPGSFDSFEEIQT